MKPFPMPQEVWDRVCKRIQLPQQQQRCLHRLLCGLSDAEIATHMNISVPTVRCHLREVRRKMRAKDRTDLVLAVFRIAFDVH